MSSGNEGGATFAKKVVKRGKGAISAELIENKSKINSQKCPKVSMLCDTMIL
jgi:hypothetical protein